MFFSSDPKEFLDQHKRYIDSQGRPPEDTDILKIIGLPVRPLRWLIVVHPVASITMAVPLLVWLGLGTWATSVAGSFLLFVAAVGAVVFAFRKAARLARIAILVIYLACIIVHCATGFDLQSAALFIVVGFIVLAFIDAKSRNRNDD